MATILLVDDEMGVLDGLRRMVRSHAPNWETLVATSGDEALTLLKDRLPDVIVSDIRMPEMDGLEFIANVRNDPRLATIPVIVLSGHGAEEDERTAWQLGIHDFVAKPVQPLKFVARIRAAIRTKRFAEYLQQQNNQLQRELMRLQKMEAMGKLAAEAAHDLNNMLTVTMGRTELARHVVDDSSELYENLSRVIQSIQHAKRLVENLRTVGSMTAGGPAVDITIAVNEAMELISLVLPPGIDVSVHCDDLAKELAVDSTRLYQLLLNLCTNAKHAMGLQGTLTVSLSETHTGLAEGKQTPTTESSAGALLRVEDTGHGISEETLQHIWEPYFTTRDNPQGTGVGLAVVKRIVDELGATVAVQSEVGTGTCFAVFIPYEATADHQPAANFERASNAEEADFIRR